MPDDDSDSGDDGGSEDASFDEGVETFEGDFDGGHEDSSGGHSESVFVLDDELQGRESWLERSSLALDEAEARAAFAEEISLQIDLKSVLSVDPSQPSEGAENPAFVDADPAALDAAAGLATDGASAEGEAARGDVMKRHLRGLLEALLFVTDRPIKVADLADVARAEYKECRVILEELAASYRADARGFQLDELAGGWQLRTSATFAPFVREMTAQKPVKLTRAQVETLAIIAYRQPVTRPEIEDVRGVDAGPVVKLLLDRDLVRVLGKKDEPGRPLLYGTTSNFLQFFGLKSLRDLPTLREFSELSDESKETVERELGEVMPEGPKETIGDASVAAADFDPIADAESRGASNESSASPTDGAESEAEPQPEGKAETFARPASKDDADDGLEDTAEKGAPDDGSVPAPPPAGGAKYEPSDEALYPDDDDEDFDEDDEDDDADEDEEDDDEEGGEKEE